MSTREMAYNVIDIMTEEQLSEFLRNYLGLDETPNSDTLESLLELRYMEQHPEEYKTYESAENMFKDILDDE